LFAGYWVSFCDLKKIVKIVIINFLFDSRTGTIIACDIALRALEQPTRSVDIPQIVYFVRRGRASAVRTREQYEFIYKVRSIVCSNSTSTIHFTNSLLSH